MLLTLYGVTSSSASVVVMSTCSKRYYSNRISEPDYVGKAVALATTASGGTGALTCGWNFGDAVLYQGRSVFADSHLRKRWFVHCLVNATDAIGVATSSQRLL